MTKEYLKNHYPKTWERFRDYFRQEGWGAEDANQLSEYGFGEWFSDFQRDYELSDMDEYEGSLKPTEE